MEDETDTVQTPESSTTKEDDSVVADSTTTETEAFPGCPVCGGSGEVENEPDKNGEISYIPCPECFK